MDRQEMLKRIERVLGGNTTPTLGGLVVRDEEIAYGLLLTADLLMFAPCPIENCEACDLAHTYWWDMCNSLDRKVAIRLQRFMSDAGVAFPPSPTTVVG